MKILKFNITIFIPKIIIIIIKKDKIKKNFIKKNVSKFNENSFRSLTTK